MRKVRCGNCKKYIEKSDAIPRGISNFCSMDCVFAKANQGKGSNGTKSSTPSKRSSVSESQRRHDQLVYNELKEKVHKSDGYRCRLCGGNDNLVFHHVIYKSDVNNKPWQDQTSNGITLCNRPCHLSIVHGNKKRFLPLCLGIIWLRETEGDRYTTIYDLEERLQHES